MLTAPVALYGRLRDLGPLHSLSRCFVQLAPGLLDRDNHHGLLQASRQPTRDLCGPQVVSARPALCPKHRDVCSPSTLDLSASMTKLLMLTIIQLEKHSLHLVSLPMDAKSLPPPQRPGHHRHHPRQLCHPPPRLLRPLPSDAGRAEQGPGADIRSDR